MNLSYDTEKINIVKKLVKDKQITFEEGIMLLRKEVEYVYYPSNPILYNPPYITTIGTEFTNINTSCS